MQLVMTRFLFCKKHFVHLSVSFYLFSRALSFGNLQRKNGPVCMRLVLDDCECVALRLLFLQMYVKKLNGYVCFL